jgi:hypothetical protein
MSIVLLQVLAARRAHGFMIVFGRGRVQWQSRGAAIQWQADVQENRRISGTRGAFQGVA